MTALDFTPKKIDLVGNAYGYLTVLSFCFYKKYKSGGKHSFWNCKCSCGAEKIIAQHHFLSGATKSCGCARDGNPSHNFSKSVIYALWASMKQRCHNKKNSSYKNYGERGIFVCNEWIESPDVFCHWAIDNGYKKGLQIDRKDNDLGYSPENCHFVTPLDNSRNRSLLRKTNTSGYCGVTYSSGKWIARIMIEGVSIHLGRYKTKILAAKSRDKYILENNLPIKLNFPK